MSGVRDNINKQLESQCKTHSLKVLMNGVLMV